MLGTRYVFSTMRKVISGQKRYRTTNNLEKSDFFVANFFRHFSRFSPPFHLILAMLGTRYEFLTMRKVISGRKRYRNTINLEKSDFFVEIFF